MYSLAAVEEFARLPVELGRHVHAAVQVGDDAPVEAQRERARAGSFHCSTSKSSAWPFGQGPRSRTGAPGHPWVASQSRSSATLCTTWRGARPASAPDSCACSSPRGLPHRRSRRAVVVVRGVADHQRSRLARRRARPSARGEHARVGLDAVSSAVRVASNTSRSRAVDSASSSPARDSAGRHREPVAALPQLVQQLETRRRTASGHAGAQGSACDSVKLAVALRRQGRRGDASSASRSPRPIT